MSTKLQEQLRRLAVPQTSALVDARRRASILFDPKEAASKDRKTIYELGLSGLQGLISINPKFKQFEKTLFEETSMHLERSVEEVNVNILLDKNITKFLRLLSPYFLLRPAHLCIEWLLRRFQIHQYNRNMLLALILPYHESNIFIKVLQTIRITKGDAEWAWLKPIQKHGVQLPRITILKRASSDNNFYSFICTSTLKTVQQWGSQANLLRAHISFYTSVIVGALDDARKLKEWHITSLLPSLVNGLRSQVLDFASSSYMIASMLFVQTSVTLKLCNALIHIIANNIHERLRESAILLLVLIFDSQKTIKPSFSYETLKNIAKEEWIAQILYTIINKDVAIGPLYFTLVTEAVSLIQTDDESSELFKSFLDHLLDGLMLKSSESLEFVRCFLNAYEPPGKSNDSVLQKALDEANDNTFNSWYSEFLKRIEIKYPTAFDEVIKEALQSQNKPDNHRYEAVRMALGHRLKTCSKDATDIYESLYHYASPVRLNAIQMLIEKLSDYKSRHENYQILQECLADRIKDESPAVVSEVLKLPMKDFVEILGYDMFVDSLRSLIHKIYFDYEIWGYLTEPVVNLLVSDDIVENYDPNLLILILMPILFSEELLDMNVDAITSIVNSSLSDKIDFLKNLPTEENLLNLKVGDYQPLFLQIIKHNPLSLRSIIQRLQEFGIAYIQNINELKNLLIISTMPSKEKITVHECLEFFKYVKSCCECYDDDFITLSQKENSGKVELFRDFILSLINNTVFENLSNWEDKDDSLLCFFTIFEDLLNKLLNEKDIEEWITTIKNMLDSCFVNVQNKIEFLTNFYYLPTIPLSVNYKKLQVYGMSLLNSILESEENSFEFEKYTIFKVMIGLTSDSETIRKIVLETLQIIACSNSLESYLQEFVESILEARNELEMDPEQLSLILFTILNNSNSLKRKPSMQSIILREIMDMLSSEINSNDIIFKTQLLKVLRHINSEAIIMELLALGNFALNQSQIEEMVNVLANPYDQIFQYIFERFTHHIIGNVLTDAPKVWEFFENVFSKYNVFIGNEDKLIPVPCAALKLLDEQTFANFPQQSKVDFIKLIIKTVALSENDEIFLDANKLMRKCVINCKPLVELFSKMFESNSKSTTLTKPQRIKNQKRESVGKNIDTSSPAWKEGLVLIELLENKRNLENAYYLIASLFELLKVCVEIDESTNVEYIKQITLSLILHCCRSAEAEGFDLLQNKPETVFRVDYVVQCLRSSHNPQTHNNALLLLSHCANIVPQQVLTEIVAIFTFMGSSVVRQEDAFSFHIINNIISSIVPILVMNEKVVSDALVVPVLKVFTDIMFDVPEHRRLLLYTQLLDTLGTEKFLWIFLCVLFEAHVVSEEKEKKNQKKNIGRERSSNNHLNNCEKVNHRMEIALEITNTFEPTIIITTCTNLLSFLQKLPLEKVTENDEAVVERSVSTMLTQNVDQCLFDMNCRTAKELRHYRYIILQFLSNISNSKHFLRKLSALGPEESLAMKPFYQSFIIRTLTCVPPANGALEKSTDPTQAKFWKVIINNLHDVLNNSISLLSPEMFLMVIAGLMEHQLLTIRRKVIELLITKLQKESEFFGACGAEHFECILHPLNKNINFLLDNADTIAGNTELLLIQQTTLMAIKLLTKHFGMQLIEFLKLLLVIITRVLKKRSVLPKVLCATVVLTLAEICSSLKAHSLSHLPKFMPHLVEILLEQSIFLRENLPDNASSGIIAGVQKLVESLPLFLGRYTSDIIVTMSKIQTRIQNNSANGKDQKSLAILQRINLIWDKMSTVITPRFLVPHCSTSFNVLMQENQYAEIILVFNLLTQTIVRSPNSELIGVQTDLTEFFLQSLEFRHKVSQELSIKYTLVSEVERTIVGSLVSWVLKLSENHFRPIYHKIFEWALKENVSKETSLTYFHLTYQISEELKTLFVLFASEFINDAARLLNECNSSKTTLLENERDTNTELLKYILGTLTNVFTYDSKQFVSTQRFEILMRPIVDQLDNNLVLENNELASIVIKSIALFAVAISNDVHWKQLNYEILMKTRSNIPEVRIISFKSCVEIARRLGEDFSTLLPETVPFIAELFEDDNPSVEENTRKSVQELEIILGESLQKYL